MLKALKTTAGLMAATIAVVALPASAAAAEYLVPPGNSAAIQYTETYPSAGGHKDAENQSGKRNRSPSKVLGERNARKLEQHGPEGEAVAEVVAETAPVTTAPGPTPAEDAGDDGDSDEGRAEEKRETGSGGGGSGNGPQNGGKPTGDGQPSETVSGDVDQSGSSGLGEVLSSAVGAPAGSGGIVLPLAFLGTLAWMLAFAWRQRKNQSA